MNVSCIISTENSLEHILTMVKKLYYLFNHMDNIDWTVQMDSTMMMKN